jgi:hypothetical protein
MKLKRREYYIVEVFSEVEVSEEELTLLSNMDEDEYQDYTYDLFDGKFKYYTTNDEYDFIEYDFKYPEVGEWLSSFDTISDNFIINKSLNDVVVGKNIHLIDSETLKTFYWDYSNLKEMNIKSFLREKKINDLLK